MAEVNNIAIIIPSFKPDDKMLRLLSDLKNADFRRVVIINDGSGAKFDYYFKTAKEEFDFDIVAHHVNLGKGRALKTGINHVLNRWEDCIGAITVDADGQHTIQDIISCAKALIKNPGRLILGCRDFSNNSENKIPLRSRFGNILTRRFMSVLCGISVSDTQTGLRGFSRTLMKMFLPLKGERYEYEMNMLLETKEQGISIESVPISTIYIEENATSHFNPLKDSARIYSLFGKYIFVTLSALLIDLALFTLMILFLQGPSFVNILISTACARLFSSIYNFQVSKKKWFNNQNARQAGFCRYFALVMILLLLSSAGVFILSSSTQINTTVCKVIVDAILFILSYLLQREWVFKD